MRQRDRRTPENRRWTLMVYMAGDNGKVFDTAHGKRRLMAEMTSAGYQDIWEMAQVGTTDVCAVSCLFDTLDGSFLVDVRKGDGMADCAVQTLPEVNTGDPDVLRDFIVDTMRRFPADHTALIIWNHGTGWLDVDVYAGVRSGGQGGAAHPPIFRTTLAKMQQGDRTRPIAYDDSSKDFLDTADLRRALSEAEEITGRRLDLIGMDACLMAMVEGARELADHASYLVASQEVEPMDGWPYQLILKALNIQPTATPDMLADLIVGEFARSYRAETRVGAETVTLSAVALAETMRTEALCRALVDAILGHQGDRTLRSRIREIRDRTLVFQDRNYRDLGDFARRLAEDRDLVFYEDIQNTARELLEHLEQREERAPVLRVAFRPRYAGATGLSVYLPPGALPVAQRESQLKIYDDLCFAGTTVWGVFLKWLDGDGAD